MKPFLFLIPLLFLGCHVPSNRPLAAQTMIAHWAKYTEPEYLDFVREARPELAQIGEFASLIGQVQAILGGAMNE